MAERPAQVMARLLPRLAPGPLLCLGCPDPAWLRGMAERGFAAEVVGFGPDAMVECRAAVAAAGLSADVGQLDRETIALPAARYVVVATEDALEGLRPEEGDRLLARVRRAVCPGGVACLAARTIGDGACARWRSEATTVAPNTFLAADGRVHRYLLPGELDMAFGDWLVLAAREQAFADGSVRGLLVARRPTSCALLV